ncbi:Xyloglucanase [Kordia antarctica]|uniref:Xyloglucanase n=1 Tax=Kordia antarctica TaxID=1218801 RepID=A0A7L4ZKT3_9FLAO|nr:T9SS sorting signal type C domain-containing protein [Kordia antarctica]QHI37029.1 Xyloglucanase [Kordia antarctica]
MKKIYLITFLLVSAVMYSQSKIDWTKMNDNPDATFYQVQENFNNYWENKTPERGKGYKPFKRWEDYMAPRVYPSGDMSLPTTTYDNYMRWQLTNANSIQKSSAAVTSNWAQLGPIGPAAGPSPYTTTGAGRVNFLYFDPTNTNTMYVGAPDGGLWKSTNGGTSWTTNTDFLTIIGCSSLAIDPTNTQIMYLATGDLEGNRNSIGILKSIDGGATWNPTGLVIDASSSWKLSKLLMDPSDSSRMIVASNVGIWRTSDGWATSTFSSLNGDFPVLKDMEFKPGLLNANTVYASGDKLYKSTDFGVNWSQITTGIPTSGVSRIALAVTAGNDAYVYAIIGKSSDQSYMGTYRSTDSGDTFSTMSTTPNLLAYAADGSDTGGQASYDLSIVASPTDADNITIGGVNHWRSFNGGATWQNTSVWDSGEIHADIHEITYLPGSSSTMFSCNDGGLFRSVDNGNAWTDISGNLAIGQVVKLGLSSNNPNGIVAGEQDNGTILNTTTINDWYAINGGDGGECFIDYTNNDIVYVQYVEGKYGRTLDGGLSATTPIQTGLPTGIDFYSPFKMHPTVNTTIYSGGTPTLYTSTNQGDNWSALGTSSGTGSVKDFVVAPSDPTVIYTVQTDAISKSTDSGTSFSNVTGTLPTTVAFSSITVSTTDANKVWITYSGYNAPNKVFKSTDGGSSWTNISTGLPNLPMNTLVYRNGGIADEIYVGADVGVFIINNNATSWQPYMTNLPHAAVRDLEIFYGTTPALLRAGTYGRGVWETEVNSQTLGIDDIVSVSNDNEVLISINNESLEIKSSIHNIEKVVVYDVLGKKVFEKKAINATTLHMTSLYRSQRILFVKTLLSDGGIVVKKILF